MAGGKVSVRQKMINMMYLVLTALLALNVSAEILKAFHMVEISMDRAGENIDKKNINTLKAIDKYHKEISPGDPKGKEAYDKSLEAKKIADDGVKYFADLKTQLIDAAGGRKDGKAEEEVAQASNIEKHANLMINDGKGKEVKAKIIDIKNKLLALLPKEKQAEVKSDLIIDEPKDGQSWESEMFEHTPLAAVVALISKTQNDIKNTEAQVLDILKGSIKDDVLIIDKLEAKIIPNNGTYITLGNKYSADIFLAASSSRTNPDITVNGSGVKVEGGVGKYEVTANREGENKFKAVIVTQDAQGKPKRDEVEGSFFALAPLAVISATKMNVVYIGLENPISVSVPGVSAREVTVTSSAGGKLKSGGQDGTFLLTVDGTQREIIINATVNGKVMGFQKYRVRPIPKPMPQLGSIFQSGSYSAGEIKAANFVITALKDFAFDGVNFTTLRWTLIYQPKRGDGKFAPGSGTNISGEAKTLLNLAKPGDTYTLTGISAQGPAGAVQLPSSLTVTVRQ